MKARCVEPVEVTYLVTQLQTLAARLAPDAIPDGDVDGVVTDLGQAVRLVQGMTTLMARRVAEVRAGRPSGPAEAVGLLAGSVGLTEADARRRLSTSTRLVDQPAVADAVRDGRLSDVQAEAVADAVAADPSAEGGLLTAASTQSVADLRRTCREAKAAADADPDATRRRHLRQRGCRSWHESDGEWKAMLSGPAEYGARFDAAVRAEHDRVFRAAHAAGEREQAAAYRLDAVLTVMERGATLAADHPVRTADGRPVGAAAGGTAPQGLRDEREDATQANADARPAADGLLAGVPVGPPPVATAADEADSADLIDATAGQRTLIDRHSGSGTAVSADADGTHAGRSGGADPPEETGQREERARRRQSGRADPPHETGLRAERARRRHSGRETKVIITVDAGALRRGRLDPDDTCHIAGIGRVSLAAVRSLIPHAHIAYVIRDAKDVAVAHLGRQVTAHQRTALEARGYECEVPGCRASHLLEIDHVRDWAFSRATDVAELAWLCMRHHDRKTNEGYRLSGPPGRRRWHDPDGRVLAQDADPPSARAA